MSELLWTLAVIGGLNTVGVLVCAVCGRLPEITPTSRAIDAVYTACIGAWALWLLAKGV